MFGLLRNVSLADPVQFISVKSINKTYNITTPAGAFVNKAQEMFKKTPAITIDELAKEMPDNSYATTYLEHQKFLAEYQEDST